MNELQSAHLGFLVVFGLGGLISLSGFLLALRAGALDWNRRSQRVYVYWGLALYFSQLIIQGYLQFVAVHF